MPSYRRTSIANDGSKFVDEFQERVDAYLAEQVFRYNNGKDTDEFARFATCMMGIQGKKLTYKALTQRATIP